MNKYLKVIICLCIMVVLTSHNSYCDKMVKRIEPLDDMSNITSYFGPRTNPMTGQGTEGHGAIDIAVPSGTPVYATWSGQVIVAQYGNASAGNWVRIDHGGGYCTVYMHNTELKVQVGDTVKQGDTIALSGSTGRSTGPHVHYQIEIDGEKVDPLEHYEMPETELNQGDSADGSSIDEEPTEDVSEDTAVYLAQSGIWDETKFVKWKVMTGDSVLEFADVMSAHEDDIYDIENWIMDVERQKGDGLLIKGGRWLAILMGIIFEVWMMFLYLAYWFDRLNNFFDFSLLYVLSIGRLRISPDETECTFSVKSLAQSEVRTINHKKLLGVVIVGLGFGAIIISGQMFVWLHSFINFVRNIGK